MKWAGFTVKWVDLSETGNLGECDFSNGVIKIHHKQSPKEELDTLIHEGLHALDPDMSEKKVAHTARQLAELLWKDGYRN